MSFNSFFTAATGFESPFPYQLRLAEEALPEVVRVPTGLGKTAAVTLAWLYKRGWRMGGRGAIRDASAPRRLVWCLPMRVLVEQTEASMHEWLGNLGVLGEAGEDKVSVHVLMGGADDLKTWAEYPEEDMILIGTQDMLLSRALMRGYGMSRYQWPVQFALLHNDAMWVFDEVQLMGAGVPTSTQLEAFRRSLPLAKGCRSLWLSATLNREWLRTVDFAPHVNEITTLEISDEDRRLAGDRLRAVKNIERLPFCLGSEARNQKGLDAYLQALRNAVLQAHEAGGQTLVIVNRVDRAQALFRLLGKERPGKPDLLIHARFRAAERAEQNRRLRERTPTDRIIVATQAIEAGVDISSKVLVTELAPWSSLVQRFGRCNRDGKHNSQGARILWVDISDDADAKPYANDVLATARSKLVGLASASPQDLPPTDEARPLTAVLRRRDLLDLFNTDPDLSGFDVDVSDYIRDSDRPGVQVFWRDFGEDPNRPKPQPRPSRAELCPVSSGQAQTFFKRKDTILWSWDTLDECWTRLDREPRPGMTLLLRAADGGYDAAVGFDADLKKPPVPVISPAMDAPDHTFGEDWRSRQNKPVALADHLGNVAAFADALCNAVNEAEHRPFIVRAGRWHDLGKAHAVFDATMHACESAPGGFLAKSPCGGKHSRPYFRHELASALAWLAQHNGEPEADLIAYLIAAHHGKVRVSLRAMPTERAAAGVKRFARGVWEGDVLPALTFDGEHSQQTTLNLALMELGEGEQGASWTARTLGLLEAHGPFRLAWLETLVRLADCRASRAEQLAIDEGAGNNPPHDLDRSRSRMAPAHAGAAAADTSLPHPRQSGAQHGLRGGAGGPEDAGSRTRPPHAATRYLDTALGRLSYADLAPHLARRVGALQEAIADGEFDRRGISEDLLLEFHARLCGDLTPAFAGRWRSVDVQVGSHEPPPAQRVAEQMRDYIRDLATRIDHLPPEPNDLWLEALAFAEGRLLSIHPFTDFNGRVTRVFIDWLTRTLDLPDVDPTPDEGAATDSYLAALRAADQHNWQPLMTVWRERFDKGRTL